MSICTRCPLPLCPLILPPYILEPLKKTEANNEIKNVFFVLGGAVTTDKLPKVPKGIGKS